MISSESDESSTKRKRRHLMPSLQLNVKSDSSSESKIESLKDAKNGSKNAEKKRFDEKRKKPKHVDKVIFKISHFC